MSSPTYRPHTLMLVGDGVTIRSHVQLGLEGYVTIGYNRAVWRILAHWARNGVVLSSDRVLEGFPHSSEHREEVRIHELMHRSYLGDGTRIEIWLR